MELKEQKYCWAIISKISYYLEVGFDPRKEVMVELSKLSIDQVLI